MSANAEYQGGYLVELLNKYLFVIKDKTPIIISREIKKLLLIDK